VPDPWSIGTFANQDVGSALTMVAAALTLAARVRTRFDAPVDRLHSLGPWLRARDWETTAVPELREHAAGLARALAQRNPVESRAQSC
jgi:hypothetical protein